METSPPPLLMSLNKRLQSALNSRETRGIGRNLPDPASSASDESTLVDFSSNDYLFLSRNHNLRDLFLQKLKNAPRILGSGGSRLLVNGQAHHDLECRLARFFRAPAALLFNSGFDANVGFFSTIPQPGDVVVSDEYIHASVHDGVRASRARDAHHTFEHNSLCSLRNLLHRLLAEKTGLSTGENSLFLAVESLYSMDGTFAPLRDIVDLLESLFLMGNGYLIVDEAHATGIYGPLGRGLVVGLGLEDRVLARLHTFGKALAATGAVILTTSLMHHYLINYARSLIYTTSLSFANVIAVDCSFDFLENGIATKLAERLLNVSTHFLHLLRSRLHSIHPSLLSIPAHLCAATSLLPTPIIPIMTVYPRPLSAYLYERGMNARPITWPTVPKGKDRVRVCLHAENTRQDVERLVEGMCEWAEGVMNGEKMNRDHETTLESVGEKDKEARMEGRRNISVACKL